MHTKRRITRLPDDSLRDCIIQASQALIISAVLADSGLTFQQVASKTRAAKIIMTRHLIHYLLSVNPDKPYREISYVFQKDHCTVIHSRNVIEDIMDTNREFKEKLITLITKIKNQL